MISYYIITQKMYCIYYFTYVIIIMRLYYTLYISYNKNACLDFIMHLYMYIKLSTR